MLRVTTLLVLVAVGVAVVAASDADWWRSALVYQIYPRSFKDSNGDGIGDLNGIREKLPYLQQLGIDAIWLSPIYKSPMYDFGYDITDYRAIATEYGTMDDFDNLMAESKALGIRVILDYVPNHTGNESEWFIQSKKSNETYKNYYIWADGQPDPDDANKIIPPNNWISIFRKSAWEWSEERGQYYLHQFVVGQPDLNYREPLVQQEMKDVISFWLDKGVSGFRVDAINMMYEVDPDDYGGVFPDEPLSGLTTDTDDYDYLDHVYTRNLPETYEVVYDWRDLLNEYTAKDGEYKIMMTEAYAELELMIKYYGDGNRTGSIPFNFSFLGDVTNTSNARDIKLIIDKWMTYMPSGQVANWVSKKYPAIHKLRRVGMYKIRMTEAYAELELMIEYYGDGNRTGSIPFNFSFLGDVTNTSNARDIKLIIDKWMTYMPSGQVANWVNGNHDQSRLASRQGTDRVDAMNMLALLLPGVTITYQGEEIGMTDGYVSWADTVDPQACNTEDPINYYKKSRDPNRTPYHWDNSTHAGFSNTSGNTWLPVANNYQTLNLANQMADSKSHYQFYKDVVKIKKKDAVRYGDLDTRALSDSILVITRLYPVATGVVGIVNLSDEDQQVDLSALRLVPSLLQVTATGVDCSLRKGNYVTKTNIKVPAHCAIVLETVRRCC